MHQAGAFAEARRACSFAANCDTTLCLGWDFIRVRREPGCGARMRGSPQARWQAAPESMQWMKGGNDHAAGPCRDARFVASLPGSLAALGASYIHRIGV
jgi:hypothetical protein